MKTKGFTLIELLVVVLIIGILSSVALPQYTKAVNKSRVATLEPVLGSILQAGQVAVLAGTTTAGNWVDMDSLDVQVPQQEIKLGTCTCPAGSDKFAYQKVASPTSAAITDVADVFCNCGSGEYDLIITLTNQGTYCAGSKSSTYCPQYGFPKSSSWFAGSDFGGAITGSVYTR